MEKKKKSNVQLSEAGKEFCTKTRQNQDRFPTLFPAVNSCRVFLPKMHLRLLLLYGGARAFISVGTCSEMRFTVSTLEEDKRCRGHMCGRCRSSTRRRNCGVTRR